MEVDNNGKKKGKHKKPPPVIIVNILKNADSPIDTSSGNELYDKLCCGVFLNQKKKKFWVEKESKNNCFMLFAQGLSITWGDDQRYWHWPTFKESSGESFVVAELKTVCWLKIQGKLDTVDLTPRVTYEVVFVVRLKDCGAAHGWEIPVNLELNLPGGSKQQRKVCMNEMPKGQWLEIPAGQVKTSGNQNSGEMEFSLYEYGGHWKGGLVVRGVVIRPKH